MNIFVDKNWKNEIKHLANDLDKEIKKQDFAQAREIIIKLLELTKSGDLDIKRDASIAVDHIIKRYGSTDPEDFLLPDWKGDFRAIKKRATLAFRTNNITEVSQIIKRMNSVISTNENKDVRKSAIEMLLFIADSDIKLIDQYEQHYIESIIVEQEKSIQKDINSLLRMIDTTYPEDVEDTIKRLSKVEKVVKIVPKFDYDNDFIRYKVQVQNNTDKTLWDVRYVILKYEKNFALRQILPESYEIFEDYVVILSVIQPGDVKEFFAKIEPRASEVYLEGKLYYKTEDDRDFTILPAKDLIVNILDEYPKLADLSEKVSIIHCREFFDFHVKYKSMNAFALPVSIVPEVAFKIGKRVLSDLGFSLIMDIVNQDNFFGEALFYGRTVINNEELEKSEEIVTILRASHENYALEINIGCNNNAFLVAVQIKFDNMLRQIITSREEYSDTDILIELRCPTCFQPYDKLDRDWCPWCGADIDKNRLLY